MSCLRFLGIVVLLACVLSGQPAFASVTPQPAQKSLAAEAPPENANWQISAVDQHTLFPVGMSSSHESHSFAIDGLNHSHIVYGEDRLYYAYHNGASWTTETVDAYLGGVSNASLTLDSDNNPHVSYCRQGGMSQYQPLMYAYKNAGQWINVAVDSAIDACGATSIGRDSAGNLKIAYFRPGSGELRVASQSPGYRWFYNTILASGLNFSSDHVNLVIGSDNLAHVSYYQSTGTKLYYFKQDAGGWGAAQLVSDTISMDGCNSLALDSGNQPHLTYVDSNGLEYASLVGGVWSSTVARASETNQYFEENSLAFDASNQPHIVYHRLNYVDNVQHDYVSFTTGSAGGTNWVSTNVAEVPNTGAFYANVALRTDGQARVAYLSFPNLIYGSEGISWGVQTLDTNRWMDYQTSLALDALDRAHISYYDVWNKDLKYAVQSSTGWNIQTLQSSGDVGKYSAIAIGPDGLPIVAFYDATNGDLKLTYDDGGGWPVVTIDSTGDVGQFVSMKSDANGYLHFSYLDATNQRLKYAYYTYLSQPTLENVDLNIGTGKNSALVLDSNNKPFIAYYDQSVGSVNLAVKPGGLWEIFNADSTVGTGASGEGVALARVPGGFMLAYGVWTGYPSQIKAKTCTYTIMGQLGASCAWSPAVTIDASAYPQDGISMAAAPNGAAYIAYHKEINESLSVVTCLGSVCSLPETPDPTSIMNGKYPSMALNRGQQPRISYIDVSFKAVKLASHKNFAYLPFVSK